MAKEEPRLHMSSVKVGPKGQIVIPKEVRDMFAIKPGDNLVLLANSNRGIAIQRSEVMSQIADRIFEGKEGLEDELITPVNTEVFANNIRSLEDNNENTRG